jgi:ribosomal protein S18 acetylase RimI-like enzyme
LPDRIISREANGNVVEVHSVPVQTNPFAYGAKMAETDRRLGRPVATYEVISPFGEIFVSCTSTGRWQELMEKYAKGRIEYRIAKGDDETDILAVLEEVATEIPVTLDGAERQEKIRIEIRQCQQTKKSWVAVDTAGKVVGFALARPDAHEGKAAIYLPYVGVSKASRRSGIFSTLVEKLKANGVSLIANVLNDNHSGMADILVKNGFTNIDWNAKQNKFLWSPAVK